MRIKHRTMWESLHMEPLAITCPRCKQEVQERFYGPCESCRTELRASMGGEKQDLGAVEYEPKMNVIPNQIATKE
jgi:Zn finger protein HypA/HybF involved in hydrogenase expression